MIKPIALGFVVSLLGVVSAWAGERYEITAQQGGKEVTYRVDFGGGMKYDQHTAFDPVSKKFVYLTWQRDAKPPEPVSKIRDKTTGEMIPLYKFPDVKKPLPIIPSLKAMKICPITGDKNFKSKVVMLYD
jgi:hypothetical protein